MPNDKKPFTPDSVDEQVDQLAESNKPQNDPTGQQAPTAEARLVQDLSNLYQEYAGTRNRVWQRLEQRMQQADLTRQPFMNESTRYERKSKMVQSDLTRRNALGHHLTLIAAVLIVAVLVGSLAFLFSVVRNAGGSGPGGHGPTAPTAPSAPATSTASPSAASKCPYGDSSHAGSWRDDEEQAICLKHLETPLHISRTAANHQVDFVAAYADTKRLVLLYIEHISPTADAVSFTDPTLQGGTVLPGGGSQSYGDAQGQRLYVQVTFDTRAIPAGTTTLHIQSIKDMLGETIPLNITLPLHKAH